ncbi:nucleotidyltransferase domain-containing protein, partial [Paenibacillus sp. 1001270B_150601_E10]|uniref:nucleotidyltransferase domain-containing protein n=1 Tax=Paenibacillus sp. 1001270B_150601_E10 TaxID=2787079 RepID=UPI001E640111
GFPSHDSDYDVRFIYVRKKEDYLSLFQKRDVIERPISDMLDISGWDLKKALLLYRKSNPPLLEWLQSPIVYMENHSVMDKLRKQSVRSFSQRACMYHYLHMARGNYREYLQGEKVRIKKYFYVLRPILACQWIEEAQTTPPIAFSTLLERLVSADTELYKEISRLLTRKKAGEELDIEHHLPIINRFIEEKLAYYEALASSIPAYKDNYDVVLDEWFQAAITDALP